MFYFIQRFLIISLAIGIIINLISTIFLQKNDLEKIISNKKIVFITRVSPATYYQVKDSNEGFEYDLMKRFSKYIGVELEILTEDNFDKVIINLNNNTADIASGYAATKIKINKLKFNYPYNRIDQVLIYNSNKNTKPKNIDDLSNGVLEVIKDSNHEEVLKNLKKNNKINWVSLKNSNTDELIELLQTGLIDYTIINSNEFEIYRQFYPEIQIGFKLSTSEPIAWAQSLKKDESVGKKMKEFFEVIINNNQLNVLLEKHFGHHHSFTFVGSRAFLKDIVIYLPKYESYFRDSGKINKIDWRLLASVSYQESRWREDAVSYTGVKGLMMLTKNTAKELGVKNREDPKESIYGGAKYLKKILARLPKDIEYPDKLWFSLAAYNLGFGHVTDAFNLAKDQGREPYRWIEIKPILLQLSKSQYYKKTKYGYARGWEALKYVQNIRQYYDILVFLDSKDKKDIMQPIDERIPQSL